MDSAYDTASITTSVIDDNETYFESKERKGKSKNSLDLIEPLGISKRQTLIKSLTHEIEPDLLKVYQTMYKQWEIEIKNRFNIVFYGLGNKQSVMADFVKSSSLNYLNINGYENKYAFKDYVKIQKDDFYSDDEACTNDALSIFKEFVNNQGSAVVLIQGIEIFIGNEFSVKCIKHLIKQRNRIILTVDDPLALVTIQLPSCIYHNIPTCASYSTPIQTSRRMETKAVQLTSVGSILSKLNSEAPKILKFVVDEHIKHVKVTRKRMESYFKSKLVNMATVNAVLEELISHLLIKELNEQGVRILTLNMDETQYGPLLDVINGFL